MATRTERAFRLHHVAAAIVATALLMASASGIYAGAAGNPFLRGLKEGLLVIVPLFVVMELLLDRFERPSRFPSWDAASFRGLARFHWLTHGLLAVLGAIALRIWPEHGSLVALVCCIGLGSALGRWAVLEVALRKRAMTSV